MAMLRAGEYKQIAPVLFGSGMAGQAGEKAKGLGISHILLIHDEGVKDAGILMRIKKTLLDAGIQVTEWDGVQTDCPDQTVERGRACCGNKPGRRNPGHRGRQRIGHS